MKKRDLSFFLISLFLIIIFTYFVLQQNVRKNLSFLWNNTYYYPVYFSLIIAFLIVFFKIIQKKEIKNKNLKIIFGLLFLPAALFPVIRCYFKIPYIFCRACPRKCPFGELRSFIIPSFVLVNLDKRFWCYNLCPFGTLQDHQCKLSKIRIKLPKWLSYLRYLFLLFTIIIVLLLIFNENFYFLFFKGDFHLVLGTFIAAIIIFILAFFIPRFWCNYFCPIGSFGDLVLKLENKIKNKPKE